MKTIVTFEFEKTWIINEIPVEINKIETNHYVSGLIKSRVRFDELDPYRSTVNIVTNVALLPNALFIEKDAKTVLARINDVVDKTLIRTQWEISREIFDDIVWNLQYEKNIPEDKFYVVSKVS